MSRPAVEIVAIIDGRAEIPVFEPPGIMPRAAREDDAPELVVADPSRGPLSDPDELVFAIDYVDSAGDPSRRTIRLNRVEQKGEDYLLHSFCFLRRAARCFYLSRIVVAYDYRTGEVIENLHGLAAALALEGGVTFADDMKAFRELKALAQPGVKALLFLAMADGHLHIREQDAILRYAKAMAADDGLGFAERDVRRWVRSMVPLKKTAAQALGKVMANPDQSLIFVDHLFEVALADGEMSEAESQMISVFIEQMKARRPG